MIIKEVYDPQLELFKTFQKITPAEEAKLNLDKYGSLPKGYVTDGRGNIYKYPTTGYSKVYTYQESGRKFRYNYGTNELEYITEDQQVIDTISLGTSSWCDNPDYWVGSFDDELQELIDDAMLEFGGEA